MNTMARATAGPTPVRKQSRRSSRAVPTEGAMILITLYTLVGAGIGSAGGSALLGTTFGLAIGVFAAAAILLIRGAAQGAESA